jgi:hypothetical protein
MTNSDSRFFNVDEKLAQLLQYRLAKKAKSIK